MTPILYTKLQLYSIIEHIFCAGKGDVMNREELLEIIRIRYPHEENAKLAQELCMSESALRTVASRNGIRKTSEYKKIQHEKAVMARKDAWKCNITPMQVGIIEQNIIVGSLLGDGSLALYGRSKNARYREHGSIEQFPYRAWKAAKLAGQGFKLSANGQLTSPSHPYFTSLFHLFYPDRQKHLTPDNLQLLNHPIGLACLYMDDGSLVIDSCRHKNRVSLFPRVYLYSMGYSIKENEWLAEHLLRQFGIAFKTKKHPDGSGCMLEINQREEVIGLLNLIKPYVLEIPKMSYKVDVVRRLQLASQKYAERGFLVNIAPLEKADVAYTSEEIDKIVYLKRSGLTDREIAAYVGRSYWGIVDKIRRLRQNGQL